MARRYGGRGEELEDLVQVGALGLVRASGRFDPSRGVAFASYAAPAVEGEIRRHLRERGPGLRLPRETQRMSNELKRCQAELAAALGRSPTTQEVAAALDADVADVETLILAGLARDPVTIPAGEAVEQSNDLEPAADSEVRVLLAGGLRALDERERRIIFLRFHADMTERQIARTVGISQAHVSRLLDGALRKLRAELTRSDPGDIAETDVISTDQGNNIAPVGAQEKGEEEQDGTVEEPAAEASETPAPTRRSSKSRAATGYSGRILVRMPSELHEQLAHAAEREEISLNRFVNDALSSSVDVPESAAEEPSAPEEPSSLRLSARAVRVALATNLVIVVIAGIAAVVLLVLALQRGV
jgi:RNA polymerase sigma-B factor